MLDKKIIEKYEISIDYLNCLSGLRTKELRPVLNKPGKAEKSKLGDPLPIEGPLKEHLKDNDTLMCAIESDDIWLRLKLSLDCSIGELDAEGDMRLEKTMEWPSFQMVLQKLCMRIWDRYCAENPRISHHRFILRLFKVKIYESNSRN